MRTDLDKSPQQKSQHGQKPRWVVRTKAFVLGAFVPWAFIITFVVATTRPEHAELLRHRATSVYGRDGTEPSLYGFGSVRVLVKFVNVYGSSSVRVLGNARFG